MRKLLENVLEKLEIVLTTVFLELVTNAKMDMSLSEAFVAKLHTLSKFPTAKYKMNMDVWNAMMDFTLKKIDLVKDSD